MKKKLKFVIVSPPQESGGSIALHALYRYLKDKKYNVKVFYTLSFEYRKGLKNKARFWINLLKFRIKDIIKRILVKIFGEKKYLKNKSFKGYVNCPIRNVKRKIFPWVGKNTVVVYPEIVYGNFMHAKNVVRWFLYHNRYENDNQAFGKNDLFVCYRDVFNDKLLNPDNNRLYVPYYNLDLYKRTNFGKRSGVCYIIRKGNNRTDLPKIFDGPIIDDLTEIDKVEVFNSCERCISYDTQTAYSGIAALCGCESIVVIEPGKKKEDYIGVGDKVCGVAYGFSEDELKYARDTKENLFEFYKNKNQEGIFYVDNFINLCKKKFGK